MSDRVAQLQREIAARGVGVCVIGPSENLRYVLGYDAIALERLTVLVVSRSGAAMIMPDFEAAEFAAVDGRPPVMEWSDRDGPAAAVEEAFAQLGAMDGAALIDDEPVLVDIAVRVGDYFADTTQQVFLGEPSDDYRAHYALVQRAQEAGVRAAVVGATAHDVAAAASAPIVDAGLQDVTGPRTGHGIGIGVHEAPSVIEGNDSELAAGMVITVEPGVYFPGRYGIRIEDTVAITDEGPRRLTRGARELTARAV